MATNDSNQVYIHIDMLLSSINPSLHEQEMEKLITENGIPSSSIGMLNVYHEKLFYLNSGIERTSRCP